MKQLPKGIIPAVVTPLTSDFKVDGSGLRKLVNHLIDGGVHGLFVVGTTGEFYALTPDEKKEIIAITIDEAGGRVPVYAGTGAISTAECIKLTQIAQDLKVDAVSILTPMFISPDQNEIYRHYKTIAESTDLPVVLYNNLPKTGVTITPHTAAALADIPNIVGIKDSSGDFTLTGEYIRLTENKDFSVLAGRDTLIHACLCYGGSGAIAACANVAPALCASIYDKYIEGDIKGSLKAQFELAPLRLAFGLGTFPAVIKEALRFLGIDTGPCFEPVGPMSCDQKQTLKNVLVEMKLID